VSIPIVKPSGWEQFRRIVNQIPVSFDERGTKESMTVKADKWIGFVDRQKANLENELHLLEQASVGLTPSCDDDDVKELRWMLQRMDDWKDLSHYCGKNISMASTKRGNEMKIHVMAFSECKDGLSVDFVRLSYRKSVEVTSVPLAHSKMSLLRRIDISVG